MDARDLFAIIGRLYAANVELMEEGDRVKIQLAKSEGERKALIQENNELKMRLSRPVNICEGVDARREEDQLKKDAFFD